MLQILRLFIIFLYTYLFLTVFFYVSGNFSALPTELSKERLQKKVFKGKTLFHAKPMNLKGFPKFDNSFFSKIGQEVEFPET